MDLRGLGKRMREARQAKKWSLDDLYAAAEERGAKVAKNTIGQVENGQGNPELETLEKIAAALGSEIVVLLGGSPEAKLLDLIGRADGNLADKVVRMIAAMVDDGEPGARNKSGD